MLASNKLAPIKKLSILIYKRYSKQITEQKY